MNVAHVAVESSMMDDLFEEVRLTSLKRTVATTKGTERRSIKPRSSDSFW